MPQLANTDLVIWLIIIGVSVVGQIIKSAGRKAKAAAQQERDGSLRQEERQSSPGRGDSTGAEDPNAELRQFFEALGVPVPEAAKPQPVRKPTEQHRERVQPAKVPVQQKKQQAVAKAKAPPRKSLMAKRQPLALAPVRVGLSQTTSSLNEGGQHRRDIKRFLGSRKTLQQAVLLREILGPPVALRNKV